MTRAAPDDVGCQFERCVWWVWDSQAALVSCQGLKHLVCRSIADQPGQRLFHFTAKRFTELAPNHEEFRQLSRTPHRNYSFAFANNNTTTIRRSLSIIKLVLPELSWRDKDSPTKKCLATFSWCRTRKITTVFPLVFLSQRPTTRLEVLLSGELKCDCDWEKNKN